MLRHIPPLLVLFSFLGCQPSQAPQAPDWPEITHVAKPWTRWWWHGSAVTKEGITSELESFKQVGLGGVEITPIFGVRGGEDQFIDFLSPQWMEMLIHTLKEANRLGLGVDMATGTGWPFGGPWIDEANAPKNVVYKTYLLKGGESLSERVQYTQEPMVRALRKRLTINEIKYPVTANKNLQELAFDQVRYSKDLPLIALMAYNKEGKALNLTQKVSDGALDWTAPDGEWELYALFQGWHGKMVERAAPGGEGNVIDHFSKKALDVYLAKFDSAFQGQDISSLRAFFNDSYEVDDASGEANWTPGFLDTFQQVNGYDLRDYLPALLGKADEESNQRVLTDFRVTIDHLIYENFTREWKAWAHQKGAIIRNQAHGSPANILDLYAMVDIPETEGEEMLKIKFASSAANVTGKQLSSSESATWLNDHFLTSLSDLRKNLERYLLGGVNHVFYHGTAYSPDDVQWPGWLFYAAVHVDNRNTWWTDLKALNEYITRIQSFMQNSQPDNDLLVYFPIYDRYAERGSGLLEHFDIRGNFYNSSVKHLCDSLLEKGVSFDLISDRQIQQLEATDGKLLSGESSYLGLLVPETSFIPLSTMEKMTSLFERGSQILFHDHLPQDVPGLGRLEERQASLKSLKEKLANAPVSNALDKLLTSAHVIKEPMLENGLQYIRKQYSNGYIYWITNRTDQSINDFIPLAKGSENAYLFDPMTHKKGVAKAKEGSVYLQLESGESCLVLTGNTSYEGANFPYYQQFAEIRLDEPWQIKFLKGGPELPEDQTIEQLSSWTTFAGKASESFSGTAKYITSLSRPEGNTFAYQLNLGEVDQSAVVYLNGDSLATLIGPQYSLIIPGEKFQEENQLTIEVTNLMANRIRFMDLNGIEYKKFYNINFPAHDRANSENGLFHADHWDPQSSGLIGPVSITRLEEKEF